MRGSVCGVLLALALVVLTACQPNQSAQNTLPFAATQPLRRVAVGKDSRLALVDPAPRLPLTVPAAAQMRVAFTLEMAHVKRLQDLEIDFVATFASAGREQELLRRRFPTGGAAQWQEATLDLSAFAGREGELRLAGEVVHGELPVADLVVWTPPALRRAPSGERTNIVLVSIDTLRADHLGCYGYERDTSPALDRLARGGTLFRDVVAAATWTLPSHASMLSGLSPRRHRATRFSFDSRITGDVALLPDLLQRAGYATAGFTEGGFVNAAFGFARGFEIFRHEVEEGADDPLVANVDDALDWIQWTSGRPFFVFLHTYAVHSPYAPRPPYDQMFGLDSSPHRFEVTEEEERQWMGRIRSDPSLLPYITSLYDAEIRQADTAIGRFLDKLAESDAGGRTCVIVTSDHGEEFDEHGRLFHNRADVFEELLRIPLLIRCGDGFPAGRVIEEPVALVDVTPTILELTGVSGAGNLDGVSLVPVLRGAEAPSRVLLSEVDGSVEKRSGVAVAQREGRYKLITSSWGDQPQLFDLAADPLERRDISAEHPELVERLRSQLPAGDAAALRGEPDSAAVQARPTPDPAVLERLRALGYDIAPGE